MPCHGDCLVRSGARPPVITKTEIRLGERSNHTRLVVEIGARLPSDPERPFERPHSLAPLRSQHAGKTETFVSN